MPRYRRRIRRGLSDAFGLGGLAGLAQERMRAEVDELQSGAQLEANYNAAHGGVSGVDEDFLEQLVEARSQSLSGISPVDRGKEMLNIRRLQQVDPFGFEDFIQEGGPRQKALRQAFDESLTNLSPEHMAPLNQGEPLPSWMSRGGGKTAFDTWEQLQRGQP